MALFNLENKIIRFFCWASILYLSWYLIYELVLKPYTLIDEKLVSFIILNSIFLLKLFGFTTFQAREDEGMQLMGIDGSNAIWIGNPCNAMTLFAFFALFILAFPGNAKNKIWFIPLGIGIIHAANLVRVISLTLINYYAPEWLNFNHNFTFTVFVYGIIFSLWMWWINLSLKYLKKREQKS